MLLVDFDNTLICSNFDLDHEYNKQKSIMWFQKQTREQATSFSWANLLLANWLQDRDFYICTNRGVEAHEQTSEALFYLFNRVPPTLYCTGTKQAVLKNFTSWYFLIDNNPEYTPNFLFTECISIAKLNEAYNQWIQEKERVIKRR